MHKRSRGPPGHATVIPVTPLRRACGAWDTETSADPGAVITYNHYTLKQARRQRPAHGEDAGPGLQSDWEIVFHAVKNSGRVLYYADAALKADRQIVFEAVKNAGLALYYADVRLRSDRAIILEAVKSPKVLTTTHLI